MSERDSRSERAFHDREDYMSKLSDIAFERYEALYEQELYRVKGTAMFASEHERSARHKVYEAVIAECSRGDVARRDSVLEEAAVICDLLCPLQEGQLGTEYELTCSKMMNNAADAIRRLKGQA